MRKTRLVMTGLFLLLAVTNMGGLQTPHESLAQDGTPISRPSSPGQPLAGPGGQERQFPSTRGYRIGAEPTGAWLFVPSDTSGNPISSAPLPLVLFFHGYGGTLPIGFLSWIHHIVERGAIVIFPDYQRDGFAGNDPETFFPNALTGIRSALDVLGRDEMPHVDQDRVATVGHSVGGVLAVNYATRARDEALPVPTVVFPMMPGGCDGCGSFAGDLGLQLDVSSGFDASTYAVVLVAEDDWVVEEGAARLIWSAMGDVPVEQRSYVTFFSDERGTPGLLADHIQPQTGGVGGTEDALDWYGTWKYLDALMACSFSGEWCEYALGDTPEQRFLGALANGVPVREAEVTTTPSQP